MLSSILALLLCLGSAFQAETTTRRSSPKESGPWIDMEHILQGEINWRDELVGFHHRPSAPKSIRFEGEDCILEFSFTSPGGPDDVRTARVLLRHPDSKRILKEKFSTLYPDNWTRQEIESAIREAYQDAKSQRQVRDNGRWEGRTRKGIRIDGYLTRDGRGIATAYPVYTSREGRKRR